MRIEDIRPGMYVQCSLSNAEGERIGLLGQVGTVSIEKEACFVVFHDTTPAHCYSNFPKSMTCSARSITRCKASNGIQLKYKDFPYTVAGALPLESPDAMRKFILQPLKSLDADVEIVSEENIKFCLADGKIDPLVNAAAGRFYSPEIFFNRTVISQAQAHIRNSPKGFKNILSSRINIYPHQVDTILRGLSDRKCRLVLADEVGLGKTIEACAILKGFKTKSYNLRVLIIVPDAIVDQWAQEMIDRFKIKPLLNLVSLHHNPGFFLIPFSKARRADYDLLKDWDVLVVDEAHKVIRDSRLYQRILNVSKETDNILLLTATPVSRRSEGYRELLSLVYPSRFSTFSNESFIKLIDSQDAIRDQLTNMFSDIKDFITYEMKDVFLDNLREIQAKLNDYRLLNMIGKIEESASMEEALIETKKALYYLKETYIIDDCVIRHRKSEVIDASVERTLIDLPYSPAGGDVGFYESECLEAVYSWFKWRLENETERKVVIEAQKLLQATTSSPYAVLGVLNSTEFPTGFEGEPGYYFDMMRQWLKAMDWEVENIERLREEPDRFYSRLAQVIKWIESEDQNAEKKYLVYSQYKNTALKFFEAFKKYFGEESTLLLVSSMNKTNRQNSIIDFQNNSKARFLVCDVTGGEGSNFQIADSIIHTDISWSPAVMEQRIGRLDRIGREAGKNVVSVVVHADSGTENDLFRVYDKGLNVFRKSLCGMEIVFDDIQEKIDDAFLNDPEHGLYELVEDVASDVRRMEEIVEEEIYFHYSNQLDESSEKHASRLISQFDVSNSKPLVSALDYWIDYVGYTNVTRQKSFYDNSDTITINTNSYNSLVRRKTLYALPRTLEDPIIFSTFNRDTAVKHERLYFIAPSNLFYDTLANNAELRPEGASVALRVKNTGTSWRGFSFCFNVSLNYCEIVKNGYDIDRLNELSKFIAADQIRINYEVPSGIICSETETAAVIEDFIENWDKYIFEPLPECQAEYRGYLRDAIKASRATALEEYRKLLDREYAREYVVDRYLSANAEDYDGFNINPEAYAETFIKALDRPILKLDSVAILELE